MNSLKEFLAHYRLLEHPPKGDDLEAIEKLIVAVYFQAVKDLPAAKKLHACVMRNESRYPRPATIRKYMRLLNLVELDVPADAGI
jgi:hypothetical protein